MIFFKLSPRDVDNVYFDSDASVDFKDINDFKDFCNRAWQNKYGYIVIDKHRQDLKQRYRTQLELDKEPVSIMKNPDEPVVFEKSVTFKLPPSYEEACKPRATKKCEVCDMDMLSSSHAKHIKSKAHLKRLQTNTETINE